MKNQAARERFRFESLEQRCLLAADVFISEFMASNSGQNGALLDEDGDSADWLELYNAGPDEANLEGWHLTDDSERLTRWTFPNVSLPVDSYLLIYASGKDRANAGEQLHTNFKLGASGEYIGLSRPTDDGSLEIVSQYRPEFPQQFTDTSFGVTQDIQVTTLVAPDSPAQILVTSTTPPTDWTSSSFDDGDWLTGKAAAGYETSVAGFTVHQAIQNFFGRLNNLTEAEELLGGVDLQSEITEIAPVVNFVDSGGSGNFGNDQGFPNDTPFPQNDFAVRATATIKAPVDGFYTFGINSDDGARLTIDDTRVINDDTQHGPQDSFGTIFLTAGDHDLEMLYFERGGGAEVELFAAAGEHTRFNNSFRLIGDVENGGLEARTAAIGGETGFGTLIATDLIDVMHSQASSAFVRVPFDVPDVKEIESLQLLAHYNDGFVAYINGVEVTRRNAPSELTATSTATEARSLFASQRAEKINISDRLDLLVDGENVLALHALNDSADADQFLIAVDLSEVVIENGPRVYLDTATPGSPNSPTGVTEFLSNDFTFDQPHGFYTAPFDLQITSQQSDIMIRYTIDGSEPTLTTGFEYTGPIAIDSTTVLRAAAFKEGARPSFSETVTYLFLSDVVQQSPNGRAPTGWPAQRSINGQQLDYGMDPQIVNNASYSELIDDALLQVPTMSLVMDVDDFIGGENGIYTNAQSHGRAWERPASLELINPDGTDGFQINAGVRVRGGYSRIGSNPKHAFRLFFRGEYGEEELAYPLFGDEGTDTFRKVDLRTTQNYSWSFNGDSRNAFVRDMFSRDVQGLMGHQYTRGEFYHLYINGQYWGLFQTEERPEANFGASYYGGDADSYDVVKSAGRSGGYDVEATDGNLDAYQRLANYFYQSGGLSDTNMEDYFKAQGMNPDGTRNTSYERLLDVDNLIDYMIITYYTSDADGPGSKFTRPGVNNFFGIFNRDNPDGFKFFEHDSEHSLDTGDAAGANYNMVTPLTTGGSQFDKFNPHWMHERLAVTNTEYRQKFGDAVYRHLYNDGVLTPEAGTALIRSYASEIDVAMIAESARWGDSKRNSPFTIRHWETAVDDVVEWIEERTPVVVRQLARQNWFNDDGPVQFLVDGSEQRGGDINGALELASPHDDATIYFTLDGSDPRAMGGEVSGQAIAYDGTPLTVADTTTVTSRWLRDAEWSVLDVAEFSPTSPTLVGDLDDNGEVGFSDFLILSRNFGKNPAEASEGDMDGDNEIDFGDFLLLSANFGRKLTDRPTPAPPAVDILLAAIGASDAEHE